MYCEEERCLFTHSNLWKPDETGTAVHAASAFSQSISRLHMCKIESSGVYAYVQFPAYVLTYHSRAELE